MKPTAAQLLNHGHGAARQLIAILVGCMIAASFANTWIVAGLFVPLVVSGGSMAPALLGAHRLWQCDRCDQSFACDLESLPAGGRTAVCPNCGAANDPDRGADVTGDRVLVDRSAFLWRPPRRWETVVFRSPGSPHMLCVKRVIGLPGEVIDIAGGDVLVDGVIARKDLSDLRDVAVAVARPQANARWSGGDSTRWRWDSECFLHESEHTEAVDWLSYHHAEHLVQGGDAAGPSILDDSTYDQNESRRLNEVSDVMLCLQLQAGGNGCVYLRVTCRGDDFRLKLDVVSGRLQLLHNGRVARCLDTTNKPLERPLRVEFAVADQRVQLALGDQTLVQYDFQPASIPTEGPGPLMAVGVQTAEVHVRNLRVFRDVYYTAGPSGQTAQYRLGKREYLLLGDNSPHSLDSRVWSPQGGVTENALLGPALSW